MMRALQICICLVLSAWQGSVATWAAPAAEAAPAKLKIGVATQGFPTLTNAALARELSGAGIRLIHSKVGRPWSRDKVERVAMSRRRFSDN